MRTATQISYAPSFPVLLVFLSQDRNYTPSLELVQLATTDGRIFLVDCRALEALKRGAVSELLTAVVKRPLVLHAADSDLRLLYLWTNTLPIRWFDTQLVAKLAGIGPLDRNLMGYADLVHAITNCTLDKSQTLSDWRIRPFAPKQLDYAGMRYLLSHRRSECRIQDVFMDRSRTNVLKHNRSHHRCVLCVMCLCAYVCTSLATQPMTCDTSLKCKTP
jgi:hypothetical protein